MLIIEVLLFLFRPENSFSMKSKIENQLAESLSFAEKKFKNDDSIQQFEKSLKEFKELVAKGVVRERGYNLLSPSDNNPLLKITVNSK